MDFLFFPQNLIFLIRVIMRNDDSAVDDSTCDFALNCLHIGIARLVLFTLVLLFVSHVIHPLSSPKWLKYQRIIPIRSPFFRICPSVQ